MCTLSVIEHICLFLLYFAFDIVGVLLLCGWLSCFFYFVFTCSSPFQCSIFFAPFVYLHVLSETVRVDLLAIMVAIEVSAFVTFSIPYGGLVVDVRLIAVLLLHRAYLLLDFSRTGCCLFDGKSYACYLGLCM